MSTTEKRIATSELDAPAGIVLRDVPWAAYNALRDARANDHVRMTYLDGTLELMSPEFVHEIGAGRLEILVRAVAKAFGIVYQGARTTTFRRKGLGRMKGQGREADTSFYFAERAEAIARKATIDLSIDPPPDLAIEVDNTASSHWKLPVFARLGVPEVWRYDVAVGSLWFGRLQGDRSYLAIERSDALPMLTREWVLSAVMRGRDLVDSRWEASLDKWILQELIPPT
jgi:Uma2 family endonuclease